MLIPSKRLRLLALAVATAATSIAWQAGRAEEARSAADAKAEAEGIIFERQQIMKQLDTDTDELGTLAAGPVEPDKLAKTTRAIAQGARDSVEAFKQKVPGGHALPEVWSNYADFSARMEKFAADTDAMAKAAEAGNSTAVMEMMVTALPCRECHDVYREKKKT